jgi:hypothetical protein
MKLESGKQYTINLYLGMKSVTFDATVSPWVELTSEEAGSGELPKNF